eukprot:jgi/Pico_ML_1/52141/g2899.t1
MADGIRRVAREGVKEVLNKGKADSVVWMIALIVVFVSISHCKATAPLSLDEADHFYIDRRTAAFGVPHTWNVLSALLHAFAGLMLIRKDLDLYIRSTGWVSGATVGNVLLALGVAFAFGLIRRGKEDADEPELVHQPPDQGEEGE